MRVLIVGASGLVGHCLWRDWRKRLGWDVRGTFHRHAMKGLEPFDVFDAAATETLLRERPDAVVMTASDPHVDHCEQHPEQSRRINVDAVLAMARAASAAKARFVFFSSDYVFDGTRAPYVESSPTAPINEYGRQKAEAERGIAGILTDHLIVRISGAFGWEFGRKNFVMQVLDRAASKTPVRAATDLRYHPTYAPDLAVILAGLLQSQSRGIYHCVGSEEMSRYELAAQTAKVFGLGTGVVAPILLSEIKSPAARPRHSSLKSERLTHAEQRFLSGASKALLKMRQSQSSWESYLKDMGEMGDPCPPASK